MAITSVTATIYGQTTPFTYNPQTGKWVGTITIPEHRGYTEEITISATNSDGQSTTYTLDDIYIFILMHFVTDRTQADVRRVKELTQAWYDGTMTEAELAEWNAGLKGALNKSDVQRIYDNFLLFNTNYISKLPGSYDWPDFGEMLNEDIPYNIHFMELCDTLDALHDYASHHDILTEDVPTTPSLPLNTIKDWNDIEDIIEKIYLRTIDHHI